MIRSIKGKRKKKYFINYTLLFALILPLIFFQQIVNGKSLVFGDISGGGDGIAQHYTAFVYFGQYLRSIFRELVLHHNFNIPMWDMSIGFGADIITTLNYYVLGDPFAFLSVFSVPQYAEIVYIGCVILRLYCAGLAFLKYCGRMKRDVYASTIGALIYVFCGYALLAPLLHPYFANPMIWFPLLLVGIEKIFAGEKPGWYIGFLAISAFSNFYFFYMLCIMIVIYAVIRYSAVIGEKNWRSILKWLKRFVIYSVWALGMAIVFVLPTVLSLLSQNRVGIAHYLPWFYPISYYKEFLGTFLTARINGYYSYMGYTVIAVPVLALLFCRREKNTEWKYYFVILTFMLLVPLFGCIMNGFTYVTNRWVWAYSFLISSIIVLEIPELYNLKKNEVINLLAVCGIYVVMLVCTRDINNIRMKVMVLLLFIAMMLIALFEGKKIKLIQFQGGFLMLVLANLIGNANYAYAERYDNYLQKQIKFGSAWNSASLNSPNYIIKEFDDAQTQRYDSWGVVGNKLLSNSAMLNQVLGTSFYFSTTNDNVSQYFDEMYLNFPMEQTWDNLDGRSALETLAAVKYFIVPEGGSSYTPFAYDQLVKQKNGYQVYAKESSPQMAYEYSGYIPRDEYEKLPVVERQAAMLQGVVLDEGVKSALPEAKLLFDDVDIPFEIECGEGIEYQFGKIKVNQENASVVLKFEGLPDSETYLVVDGLNYAAPNTMEGYDEEEWNHLSKWTQIKRWIKSKSGLIPERRDAAIYIQSNNATKYLNIRTWKDGYYCGRHNFLSNIGYNKEALNQIILTFPITGTFDFDSLEIVCQPIKTLEMHEANMINDSINLHKLTDNEYQCEIETSSSKFVCFSIPYSKGWSAIVNGEKITPKRANIMFLGVEVPKGNHVITLRYETPYIKYGLFISLFSIILYIWFRKRYQHKLVI